MEPRIRGSQDELPGGPVGKGVSSRSRAPVLACDLLGAKEPHPQQGHHTCLPQVALFMGSSSLGKALLL